ncbi:MAG: DNA repair protein RecN [Calditrichota bacterium]
MLRRLVIQNYLLVRQLELEFSGGLTVLTGETGAGKSMILGALDVLLGARFPKDSIGTGADRAIIEGTFRIDADHRLQQLLAEIREGGTDAELIIRRELSANGRSRTWLDDRPATQDDMQRLRTSLADFHGQREHQSLFDSHRQLEFLDTFAGTMDMANAVKQLFLERTGKKQELARARTALDAFRKDQALLEYQLDEIERLGLNAGEEEELDNRLRRMENLEKLAEESARLLNLLSESEPSLVSLSGLAKSLAGGIAKTDSGIGAIVEELADIASRAKDIAEQVREYHEGLALDAGELAQLRERRGVLWELRRKHGMTVEQILARAAEMQELLTNGAAQASKVVELESELNRLSTQLSDTAVKLSKKRRSAAKVFSKDVAFALKPLGFAAPEFEAALQSLPEPVDADLTTDEGADRVEYLFSANPGSAPAPIQNVASGGESSRVTLAIKSVLSEKVEYPLMIYDEIDIGISGRVADQVGKALEELARRHQVIVITHLPQIASRADHHLTIEKNVGGATTETTARFLAGNDRVQAIAALIAGAKVTDKSLASASELLKQNGKSS